MHGSSARTLAIVLFVIGIALAVIGVLYLTIPADKLPSILGQLHHVTGHRTKRADLTLVLAIVSLIAGGLVYVRMGRTHKLRHS